MDGFYHYSSARKWDETMRGGGYSREGLLPLQRFINLGLCLEFNLPAQAERNAIFGLQSAVPPEWMRETGAYGDPILESTLSDLGDRDIVLLHVRVTPQDDVYVADYGVHLDADYRKAQGADREILGRVKRAYADSLVPFFNYKGGHRMPEVICFSDIPLSRVQVMDRRPFWQVINKLREGTDRPAMMPPREADDDFLRKALGMPPKPKPQGKTSNVVSIFPRSTATP